MQRPSGNAAVRLSLWTLLIATFAMALVQPVQGGTEAAPEIQDPANDQAIGGDAPACAPTGDCAGFAAADILTGWIEEDATNLYLNIRANGAINGGQAQGTPTTHYGYTFSLTVGETAFEASADVVAPVTATPGGVATAAVINDTLLTLTVPKAGIGSPAIGATASALTIEAVATLPPLPFPLVSDSAGDGTATYTFTGGSGAPVVDPNDTDGDGLNDTCEQQYFGNLTAENATNDTDGDGLTNGQECALGTDPTNADTDGDGVNDQDDSAPTDPTSGGTTTSTSSTTTSTSSTSSTTSRSSTTTTTGAGDGGDGDVKNLGDAVDRLEANPAYLGMSSGGFLAVLVLCIIALAVRWSL